LKPELSYEVDNDEEALGPEARMKLKGPVPDN